MFNDKDDLPATATRAELIARVNTISANLEELLEIFRVIQGGVKFFVFTSKVVQWAAGLGAAAVALAGAIYAGIHFAKTGNLPYDH